MQSQLYSLSLKVHLLRKIPAKFKRCTWINKIFKASLTNSGRINIGLLRSTTLSKLKWQSHLEISEKTKKDWMNSMHTNFIRRASTSTTSSTCQIFSRSTILKSMKTSTSIRSWGHWLRWNKNATSSEIIPQPYSTSSLRKLLTTSQSACGTKPANMNLTFWVHQKPSVLETLHLASQTSSTLSLRCFKRSFIPLLTSLSQDSILASSNQRRRLGLPSVLWVKNL